MNDDQLKFEADLLESVRQMVKAGKATVRRIGDGETVVLRIYKAESGQWSGRVYDAHGDELGGVAGCESPEEVERVAIDHGHQLTHVVVDG